MEGAGGGKPDSLAAVESVKTAADVYPPVDCEVVEVNKKLVKEPDLVNKSPVADGAAPRGPGRAGVRRTRGSPVGSGTRVTVDGVRNLGGTRAGWIAKVKVLNPAQLKDLLDEAAYTKHCESETAAH